MRGDTVKPRFEQRSYEITQLIEKAAGFEKRISQLEKAEGHKEKIISCLKKKGGAASLEECAKECGVSTEECKKIIKEMDNVKMSPHGDVILTDGLEKGKKECPSCGEELEKGACMKMGCGGKMEKAEGEFRLPKEKITDVHPEIHSESGGQTRNAYYTTNGTSIESEVAKPKRKKDDKKTDVEGLGRRMNPHEGGGAEKENFMGGER